MSSKPISDLHCHSSLKSFRNQEWYPSIWKSGKNKPTKHFFKGTAGLSARGFAINRALNNMATYSQSSLDDCFRGDTRLVFCAIYPFERPFIRPNRPFKNAKWFHRFILRTVIFRKKVSEKSKVIDAKISSLLSGASMEKYFLPIIRRIHDPQVERFSYYDEYEKARLFLVAQHNSGPTQAINGILPKFKLVRNYGQLIQNSAENVICGILTVEGMHSFANYRKSDILNFDSITKIDIEEQRNLEHQFITAVIKAKSEEFVPFFITFAHHFNNLLSGHATSFINSTNYVKPGFDAIFNQKPGLNVGMSKFGKDLILQHLLPRTNGPRILIDIKHMSIQSRIDFYSMIEPINDNASQYTRIPILCSHAAVNGFETFEQAQKLKDRREHETDSFVSRFQINLTNQDLSAIFDSDGLIGICLHDGRMPGGRFRKKLIKAKKNRNILKKLHVQIFLTNVFHIVKTNLVHIAAKNVNRVTSRINEIDAWKTIALGSDYDGIVDPFDVYNTAAEFKNLKSDVIHYLNNYEDVQYADHQIVALAPRDQDQTSISAEEVRRLMRGQTAEQVADRVFYDNTDTFLSKYFTEHYLRSLTDNPIL